LESPAKLPFLAQETLLEHGDRLGALPVETARDHVQALLEPLRARVADVAQLFREHSFGLARERLHRPIELARQPCCRILACGADRIAELLCGSLGEAGRCAVEDALELLDLPPFDLRERDLDPAGRFGLFALDLVRERTLSAADSLAQLVQRAAPLG